MMIQIPQRDILRAAKILHSLNIIDAPDIRNARWTCHIPDTSRYRLLLDEAGIKWWVVEFTPPVLSHWADNES